MSRRPRSAGYENAIPGRLASGFMPEASAGTSTSSPNSGPHATSVAAAAAAVAAVAAVASCPRKDPALAALHFVLDSVAVAVFVVGFDFLSFVPTDFPAFR